MINYPSCLLNLSPNPPPPTPAETKQEIHRTQGGRGMVTRNHYNNLHRPCCRTSPPNPWYNNNRITENSINSTYISRVSGVDFHNLNHLSVHIFVWFARVNISDNGRLWIAQIREHSVTNLQKSYPKLKAF